MQSFSFIDKNVVFSIIMEKLEENKNKQKYYALNTEKKWFTISKIMNHFMHSILL